MQIGWLAKHFGMMTGVISTAVTVLVSFGISAYAQTPTSPAPVIAKIQSDLSTYGDIDLYVFKDRQAFLDIMDRTIGLKNIANPDTTFAKLPRSPFTITGRQNGKQIPSCQIFVPANIAPNSGNEIFAQLMRGWFGPDLTYGSSAELTFSWLLRHEARHCMPDHYGDVESHGDEVDADIFAFKALSETIANTELRNGLRADIIAFRMITSAIFADNSHMIGLSVKYGLKNTAKSENLTADEEISAFRAARKLIFERAKARAAGINPTNLELIGTVSALRDETKTGALNPGSSRVSEILIDLDDAIAHLAPRLHASVANLPSD